MNKRQKEVEKAKLEAEKRELNHLKAIYKKASEDISNKIAISDGKINVLLKDIDNLDDTQKSILQSQIYQKKFQENLKKQIDGFMQELESKQYESVDAYLKAAYETGYIGTMYDIAGQGIPLVMPIDQKAAARAMTHDTKLSKRLYTKLGEDVNLLKKRVANNIARGIATADSYVNIARNIAEGTNIGINRTMTIARTEGHRIQVLGAVDAQQKAKDTGADIVKMWSAALDGRTRPHHRMLDGQIRELDEPFEVDGMNPMYPSGFGKAAEDINCRCALLQRARWALDEEELETLKKRAEFYGLDKTKDFNDYKKKYLTASTKSSELTNRRKERLAARNAAKNNTLPDFSTMSNAGLKNYAEKNLKTQFVDFTGVNNEYAADAVKVIAEFEQKFGGTLDSLKVKFGGLPKGVYAKFDDKTNTLILKKTGSKKAFEEAQKADNFRYKHKWKTDTPYYATETYTGTIWHELAHAIDISENQNLSRALSKTAELDSLSARISAYARTTQNVRATKRSEAWAENFAAYMEGGETAKRVPKEIADMIEDYFKKTANASKGLGAKIGGEGLIPLHEEPVLLKKIDNSTRKVIQNELKDFEKGAIKESVETACIVTTNGEVYKCFGVNDRVFPDYDLGDKLKGATVTHNHPIDETVFSFSKDDLQLFMQYDLNVLRGCDEKYTYEFNRNPADIDDMPVDWMTFENYNHADIIRLAKEYGIGYRRWKNE